MRLIAFDPGLSITGYACLEADAAGSSPRLVEAGHFDLRAAVARRDAAWGPRLVELAQDVHALLARTAPDRAAVEAVFAHRAHPAAALAMAHARGVILERLAAARVPLLELAPASVKKALTGSGRASKDQVAAAVVQALNLHTAPEPRDVSDAIAVALAAARRADDTTPSP